MTPAPPLPAMATEKPARSAALSRGLGAGEAGVGDKVGLRIGMGRQ